VSLIRRMMLAGNLTPVGAIELWEIRIAIGGRIDFREVQMGGHGQRRSVNLSTTCDVNRPLPGQIQRFFE